MFDVPRDFDYIVGQTLWDLDSWNNEVESISSWVSPQYTKRIMDSFNPLSQNFPPIEENHSQPSKKDTNNNEKQIEEYKKHVWLLL